MRDGGEYLTSVNTLKHTLIKKTFGTWMCTEDFQLKNDLGSMQTLCVLTSDFFNL